MKLHGLVFSSLLCCTSIGSAQGQVRVDAGVAAGVPLTDILESSSTTIANGVATTYSAFHSGTKRFLVGPVVRLEFTSHWGLEFDALYQCVDYDTTSASFGPGPLSTLIVQGTALNRWQFPLLVQYRRHHFFAEAGLALSHLGNGYTNTSVATNNSAPVPQSNSGPSLTQGGVVAGAGVDFTLLRGHVRPEIRYSHWFSQTGGVAGIVGSTGSLSALLVAAPGGFPQNRDEVTFLLSWTLGK
jgi:hypothetical protein